MQLTVSVVIEVDTNAYATDYGLYPADVAADAGNHIPAIVKEAVEARADQLGSFSVVAVAATTPA